jgi:hypothetical protein
VDGLSRLIGELSGFDEVGMTPGVVVMSNLETVKAGQINVGRELRTPVEIVETPAAHQPDRHVVT